jgi:CubicO group peptidase (beta-lactamase class C family)
VNKLLAAAFLLVGPGSDTPSPVAACLAPAGLSPVDRLAAHLRQEEASGFSGAVLVARGDSILFSAEFGRAASDGHPTAFWIASISKSFAATAVMQLVERGAVTLQAPLSTWFPDAPPAYASVTPHHLLSHRSGLPGEYAADGVADRVRATRVILRLAPRGKVGEFFYSNDGYSLLAILVELVTGSSYEDYVRSNILEPAGMTTSGFWGFEPVASPVARPLRAPSSRTIWAGGRSVANYGYRGATGIFATPEDLYRFARSFMTGKLVSPATVQLMISSKNPDLPATATSYGYGWALRLREGVLAEFWHGGNESPLGHTGQLRISGDDVFVTLSSSGEVGGRSWAARIDDGMRACLQ